MAKTWFIFYRGNRWIARKPCRWLPRGRSYFYVLTGDRTYGMCALSYKGVCRVMCRVKTWGLPARPEPVLWEKEYPSVKKVKRSEVASVKHLAALESELLRDHLSLVEHMACMQYEDGEAREPGWITIRTTGAAWQVVVKDPDSACSFTAIAKTLDEAISTASLLLGCEEAPWEPDAYLSASKARKGKK